MTLSTPKDSPDLRGRILAWIDAELAPERTPRVFPNYKAALRALRGEVERHDSWRRERTSLHMGCIECNVAWPCPTLQRIASELGVEP